VYPIHIGDPQDIATARELLVRANFTEPAIAAMFGVPILTQQTIDGFGDPPRQPSGILHLLIRLFVRNSYVDEQSIGEHLSAVETAALERLGLIAREPDNSSWYSPVCLCPVGDVYTISDRWKGPDGKPLEGREDIVYPSVVPNTRLFLDMLPDSRCESFLDLCSGTGVAALIAGSRYAEQAYAYDIAARSTHFAEFARLLNGLTNVTTGTGDLYEPARGTTFDRIVAHPPYVPVLESKWIFFDGGDDGERVTRRIIEEAPRHLREGGTLYCLAMASDRAGAPLEHRIREWLGPQQHEFDVAVVVRRTIEPQEFAFNSLSRGDGGAAPARQWKELFEARRITALPYAMMMVERKAAGRKPLTLRRQTGHKTSREEHQWLLDWENRAASDPEAVLNIRLRASPDCELRTLSRFTAGDWEAHEHNLAIDHPFRMEMKIDAWIAYLLTRCHGTRTGAELFDDLKSEGIIHSETVARDFAQVLATLVSGGFLLPL
jgi:methylase of polypeptide subunit release factors